MIYEPKELGLPFFYRIVEKPRKCSSQLHCRVKVLHLLVMIVRRLQVHDSARSANPPYHFRYFRVQVLIGIDHYNVVGGSEESIQCFYLVFHKPNIIECGNINVSAIWPRNSHFWVYGKVFVVPLLADVAIIGGFIVWYVHEASR